MLNEAADMKHVDCIVVDVITLRTSSLTASKMLAVLAVAEYRSHEQLSETLSATCETTKQLGKLNRSAAHEAQSSAALYFDGQTLQSLEVY